MSVYRIELQNGSQFSIPFDSLEAAVIEASIMAGYLDLGRIQTFQVSPKRFRMMFLGVEELEPTGYYIVQSDC